MLITGYKFQVGDAEIGFNPPTPKEAALSFNIKKIASGTTVAGNTKWKDHEENSGGEGFYLYVSTESAGFESTPIYLITLAGKNDLWRLTGTASVYNPTAKGFEVYLRYPFLINKNDTPDYPNLNQWHLNWVGIELKNEKTDK